MKIVLFSDSHGDAATMLDVTGIEKPDMIIFLGDGMEDAEKLSKTYPETEIIKVPGNKDVPDGEELIKTAEIQGKRFVITHGHTFIKEFKDSVQTDEDRLRSRNEILKYMLDNNADIFLHGHTHEPYINRVYASPDRVCWVMNPGSIRNIPGGPGGPVYGVLILGEAGEVEWSFKEA